MSQRIQSHQMKEVSTMRSIKVVAAIVALGLVSLSPLHAAPRGEPRTTDVRIEKDTSPSATIAATTFTKQYLP